MLFVSRTCFNEFLLLLDVAWVNKVLLLWLLLYVSKSITILFCYYFTFCRLSLLCSRYFWLIDQWTNLQWDNVDIKQCREQLCESCAGLGDDKCSMDPIREEYYGYEGALKCLKWGDGDVAFIDGYSLDDIIANNGYIKEDFVILCPDGKTVDYTGTDSFKECNFGRVPSNALVTCNMHDGVWRWKVTKALLEALKVLNLQGVTDDAILGKDVESLTPISFVNQTYQVWLGQKFLRAMEGFMQPPGNLPILTCLPPLPVLIPTPCYK